jgi:hypothetical protein
MRAELWDGPARDLGRFLYANSIPGSQFHLGKKKMNETHRGVREPDTQANDMAIFARPKIQLAVDPGKIAGSTASRHMMRKVVKV